jgi:hypothetical protein
LSAQLHERRGARATVGRGNAHEDVVDVFLRVLDDHVEVTALVENAGVEELRLRIAPRRGGRARP